MATIGDVFQNALKSVYDPQVLSFALACGFIALAICLLDWVGTLLLGRSSLLGVGCGGWRTFQSILLWGVGAVLGAYLGGLVQLFDIESVNARVIVGIGWPTVLPRLLGYRSFLSELEIRESIKKSKSHDSSSESPDDAGSLLIFETSRQHTWLVATRERLYFILDDARKPAPEIKRTVRRSDLKTRPDGRIAVDIRSTSTSTGLVDVGFRRRGWLYSKDLFARQRPIEDAIHELLGDGNGRTSSPGSGETRHAGAA